ncbi:signal recognition particle subunit SRP68-like [Penaeus japonicus]|uniref:signal recognition particle subunit SRP68-like n=1 Tax=Penaeus japonicus TaxID=27405 RepID=UPI001C711022|nr:signal recognition particle subunit SRP68-like [Penaeus japonicus]
MAEKENTTESPAPVEKPKQGPKKTLATVKVLKVVKEAQLAHGLRHNDYQLYRQYCSRRIRRLRKNLKLIQGDKKNFRKKEVTVHLLKDDKFLFIPLMTIERSWAYAMQLKEESLQDNRKKFSMRNKLRKAAKYVAAFEKLVEESGVCDARTQLEVQGYSAWLQGTVLFELADWSLEWDKPVEFFNKALAIYSKLKEAVSEEESEIYASRLQELEVKLRFCRHHLGDKMATDTLLAMRGSEALGDKLDNLLASARERQASTLSEVTWRGRTLAVKHEKVRLFLLNEGLIHEELENIESADKRVEMLDKLLMECKDALQLVRDDLKNDPTFKPRQQANEGAVSPLHFLHTYLSYHRLNLTILRNVALVDTYQKIISGEMKVEEGKKAPKLQDLVRLQEIIIQNLNEITNLAGLEDDLQLKNSVEGQVFAYKAHRCYFVAESFVKMEKWAEALVLYERTLAHISAARKSPLDASVEKNLDKLSALVDSKKFTAHAQAILVSETAVPNVSKLSIKDKKMLINRLDEYVEDPGLFSNHPSIAQVPPLMVSVPCKPLFFDLALNHIDFPSLDDKIETKKQTQAAAGGGLTGLVKGLWGWGSKK